MEKIKSNYFLLFWSLLAFGAMTIIWFLPWRFQVNDDEIMMWLVSGAYTGTPESYAVFIHPILSWTFSKLYTLAPAIPWYPLTWFLVIYLGYFIFLIQVTKINTGFWTKLVWILFLFGLLVHFLFFLQFTIVSAFAITAGLASRLIRLKEGRIEKWYAVYPSDILLFLGMLIRQEVPFLLLAGVLVLNFLVISEKRIYKLLLIPISFLLMISLVSYLMVDEDFQKVNRLRSQVFDHPVLQLNTEDFKFSYPELYYFANGLIEFDENPTLATKLVEWKGLLDKLRFEELNLNVIGLSLTKYMLKEKFIIGLGLLFILIFNFRHNLVILSFLIALIVLLSPFYLIKVQIYVIVFLLYLLISLFQSKPYLYSEAIAKGVAIVLISGICFHLYSFTKSYENFPSTETLEKQIRMLIEEGVEEVILVASGEVYHDLTFENPLPFKVLGWPTLLESVETDDLKRAYLVDSATYSSNASYFKEMELKPSMCDQVLLISKE